MARPPPVEHDLTVWVFDGAHARTLRDMGPDGAPSLVEQYERRTGKSVGVQLIPASALDTRLMSVFNAARAGRSVPDLVALEIGSVGKFFRPPVREVGFVPLNDFLRDSGWLERILPGRFAPWSKHGVIFGLPRDVHPVTITYRKDLFDEGGVDPASARTWPEFHERCLRFQRYWRSRGRPERHAMELRSSRSDDLQMMLLQRGVNAIDDRGRIRLTDPKVAETLAFYVQLVAGPMRIGTDPTPGGARWVRDLAEGHTSAALTPDYRIADLRTFAPELAGKLAMMPLPQFEPGDAPTSTWGGTMIGIPRRSRSPRESWELMQFLYLSPEAAQANRQHARVLPAVSERWDDPFHQRPDPLFGGQPTGALYAKLAARIPDRCVSPHSVAASGELSLVLRRAVGHVKEHGGHGLRERLDGWLAESQARLQRRVEFAKFEP